MFDALDADSDGEITTAELRKAVAALRTLDRDEDGVITREEAGVRGGRGGPGDPGQMVDRWMEMDADGDGQITPDELGEMPEFVARQMMQADTDGDGALSRDELTTAAEEMAQRFGGGGRGGPGGGFGGGGFGGGGPDPARIIAVQGDRTGSTSIPDR